MVWRSIPHAETLLAQWQALGESLDRDTPQWRLEGQRLLRHWARWPRAYHDTTHLHACLRHWHTVRTTEPHAMAQPQAIALALWFHDAIYWPWSAHNEERSAEWAVQFMQQQGLSGHLIDPVRQYILDTRHHENTQAVGDSAWVQDIDLAILGQSPAVYQQFENNVRREYGFVPRKRYQKGRSAVLQSFLKRPRIYTTAWFYQQYEAQARSNMQAAISALQTPST